MADAGVRRNKPEIVEGGLAPAQERVALDVTLEFDLGVFAKRIRRTEEIDLHRVVDDQIHGRQRIDSLGIAAEPFHRLAHRREIDHRRHACKILHQHTRRHEGDLFVRLRLGIPVRERLDVGFIDVMVVFLPEQVFQ